jgi:DNA-binding winged helix-turn-helix (wHTH) protein/Tol biopolymer transport system component
LGTSSGSEGTAAREIYEFGRFRLDPLERVLQREGTPVSLPPKAFDVLTVLVRHAGRLVKKEQLLSEVWGETFVDETNVPYTVSLLRKALGDGRDPPEFIETVPTRGYRFIAVVRPPKDASVPLITGRRRLAAVLVLGGTTVALTAAIVAFGRSSTGRPVATRFALVPPAGASFGVSPAAPYPAVSPDGRAIAFIASRGDVAEGLWVRDLRAVEPHLLPGITGAAAPFWSPDGRWLGFFSQQKLQLVPATGGTVRTLSTAIAGIGGTWSRDNVIVFSPFPHDGLFRIDAADGVPKRVTTVDGGRGESHRFPVFLPDGRRFLYLSVTTIPSEERRVCLAAIEGREAPACFASVDSHAVLAPSGHLLFVRGTTLLAQRFDSDRLRLDGDPIPVADGVVPPPTNRKAPMSVGGDVLAFRSTAAVSDRLVWVDRRGRQLGTVTDPGDYWGFSLSPDGRRLALDRAGGLGNGRDVWVVRLDSGHAERMTFDPAADALPVWSPDGLRFFFSSARTSLWNVYEQELKAPGRAQVLMPRPPLTYMCARDVSPNGQFLLVDHPGAASSVYVVSLRDHTLQPIATTSAAEHAGAFAPDGHSIAYASNESGSEEVYVQPFPPSGTRWQVSRGGGRSPRWRHDGRELFYVDSAGTLMAVPVETRNELPFGPPQPLFAIEQRRFGSQDYEVGWAGDRFLVRRAEAQTDPPAITVVLNWAADLRQ